MTMVKLTCMVPAADVWSYEAAAPQFQTFDFNNQISKADVAPTWTHTTRNGGE